MQDVAELKTHIADLEARIEELEADADLQDNTDDEYDDSPAFVIGQSSGDTERIETSLFDIVEDAAFHAGLDGYVRLERVEVTNESLANVALHLRSVESDTDQEVPR